MQTMFSLNPPFLLCEKAQSRLHIYSLSAHLFTAGFTREKPVSLIYICLDSG